MIGLAQLARFYKWIRREKEGCNSRITPLWIRYRHQPLYMYMPVS